MRAKGTDTSGGFFDYSDVPEPSSLTLFGLGAAVVGLARRRLFR
jgi:hypothetical protein